MGVSIKSIYNYYTIAENNKSVKIVLHKENIEMVSNIAQSHQNISHSHYQQREENINVNQNRFRVVEIENSNRGNDRRQGNNTLARYEVHRFMNN